MSNMGNNSSNNDFNALIIQQLNHISNQISKQTSELNAEIQSLKKEMSLLNAKFEAKDGLINSLENWKKDVSQIVTLHDFTEIKSQKQTITIIQNKLDQHDVELINLSTNNNNDETRYSNKFKEIDESIRQLQEFKIKAFTIFSVVQIIMTVALFWKEMFGK
jgi:hypothetical protein